MAKYPGNDTTREIIAFALPHLPQKQQETFVRKSFSPSATFAELHCSTI